jgi:phthalate 4,5-cis-dihydrodiol dehydrogenase
MSGSTDRPRIGMVGCGEHAFATLLPTLASLGASSLVATCDLERDRAARASDMYGATAAYGSAHELLDESAPTAVVLAGPPQMHEEVAADALSRGIHVFVEKPPATSTAELAALVDMAARTNAISMVGHNLRYSAVWLLATNLLSRPGFGEPIALDICYLAAGPRGPRWGLHSSLRSFLLTHAIHVLDLAMSCMGPVEDLRVWCREIEDQGMVLSVQLRFSGQRVANLLVGTAASKLELSIQLATDRSHTIRIDSLRHLRHNYPITAAQPAYFRAWEPRTLDNGSSLAGYHGELSAFFDAVRGHRDPSPSLRDELGVYRTLDLVQAELDSVTFVRRPK